MKRLMIGLAALAAWLLVLGWLGVGSSAQAASTDCDPARPHTAGDFNEMIVSGAITRDYILHVPPSYSGDKAVPLVVNLHGLGSSAAGQASYSGLPAKADAEGFIVVMPQGLSTALVAQPHWNIVLLGAPEADDLGFIADLLDALESQLCVDSDRIYAAGMSNGAQMTSRLACSLSDRIAAAAPVSGVYFPPLAVELPEPGCPSARPVPIIAFHGTADTIIPFDGGPLGEAIGFDFTLRDIDDEIMPDWAARNGCDSVPTEEPVTVNVRLIRYQGCDKGATVELYVIDGGAHVWPGATDLPDPDVNDEISANDLLWDFFVAHPFVAQPVGGLAVDLDGDQSGLSLGATDSFGGNALLLAGIIAGVSVIATTVTGVAGYARRRLR